METIEIRHPAVLKAARWLRDVKLKVPNDAVITSDFEKEFKCSIILSDLSHGNLADSVISFDSDEDAMLFLLRWA